MDAMNHFDFIAASYAAAIVIVAILIGWVTLDYRAQRRTLAELDMQGFTRRSGPARAEPTTQHAEQEAKEQA
jgi:heme exporter protein D